MRQTGSTGPGPCLRSCLWLSPMGSGELEDRGPCGRSFRWMGSMRDWASLRIWRGGPSGPERWPVPVRMGVDLGILFQGDPHRSVRGVPEPPGALPRTVRVRLGPSGSLEGVVLCSFFRPDRPCSFFRELVGRRCRAVPCAPVAGRRPRHRRGPRRTGTSVLGRRHRRSRLRRRPMWPREGMPEFRWLEEVRREGHPKGRLEE
jgi:hypothetical protein